MTATITAERLAFTWSCHKTAEGVSCIASGTERDEYERHVRGHGAKSYHPAKLIRLGRTAPAATLRKAAEPVTAGLITWTARNYANVWREDQGGLAMLGEAERAGQFWADHPHRNTIWVLPSAPAPWETGPARPVALYRDTDGAWSGDQWREGRPMVSELWLKRARGAHAERMTHWGVTVDLAGDEPAHEDAPADEVVVYDVERDEAASVSRQEAAAGMVRYARTLGPGTPACGEYERRALALARNEDHHSPEGEHVITGTERQARRDAISRRAENARRVTAGEPPVDDDDTARVIVPRTAQGGPQGAVALRVGSAVIQAKPLIDGDATLRYIYTFLKHFACWGSEAELVCATLWVAQTHARDDKGYPVWQYCARLAILGPSGSGKSWKSRLIGKLSRSGEILVEPSAPAFIDLCAENHTVIMTEADEAFRSPGRSRKILAVANASYEPDRSSSRKQGGVAVKIPLFCHLVLDGIDDVLMSPNRPDLRAMMSRCLVILSRKAPEGYRPPRFDGKARATAVLISQRASGWMTQEVVDGMADDVPVVPEHMGNRPFALWEPLFIVAQRADNGDPDGPWSTACREACEQLEAAAGVPDQTEDQETELDRQMAAYGFGEDDPS